MDDLHKHWPGFIAAVRTAEAGSFSEAARRLALTPAAVGKSVAQLEARLGVRLFNRTTRRLSLTAEGEGVVERARAALQALGEAGAVPRSDGSLQGLVRISCGVGFGRRHVLPVVAELLSSHARLQIELNLTDSAVDLVQEGFAIGIRGGVAPPQGMVARRLGLVPMRLVASPRYLSKQGTPGDWSELAQHRLIGVRFASGRLDAWCFRSGGQVHALAASPQLLVSAPEAAADAALLHQGIAQVALHHAWEAIERGSLKTLLLPQHVSSPVPLAIFYPHREGLAPRVRAVVDHLLLRLRGQPQLGGSSAA